jgi:hypothetical protein
MPTVMINHPAPGTIVAAGQQVTMAGRATGTGGPEPYGIDSATIRVDGGATVAARGAWIRV